MEDFWEQTREVAKAIRGGSLYAGDEYPNAQQVHRSSWRYLADINDLGFLTMISQDSLDWRSGYSNPAERSYVAGWVPTNLALKFIEKFNFGNNDKFACICTAVPKEVFKTKKVIGITNYDIDKSTQQPYIRGLSPGFVDMRAMSYWMDKPVSYVEAVDCKWGRPARSKKGLWKAVILALRQISTESS